MKECHIARRNNWHLTWACQKLETCSGELLLLLPRLATPLGLPWIPFISIELVCHWTGSFKIWSTLLRPHVNQGEYPQSSILIVAISLSKLSKCIMQYINDIFHLQLDKCYHYPHWFYQKIITTEGPPSTIIITWLGRHQRHLCLHYPHSFYQKITTNAMFHYQSKSLGLEDINDISVFHLELRGRHVGQD